MKEWSEPRIFAHPILLPYLPYWNVCLATALLCTSPPPAVEWDKGEFVRDRLLLGAGDWLSIDSIPRGLKGGESVESVEEPPRDEDAMVKDTLLIDIFLTSNAYGVFSSGSTYTKLNLSVLLRTFMESNAHEQRIFNLKPFGMCLRCNKLLHIL